MRNDFSKEVEEQVTEELDTINVEERYDDMLDECYSFESVGGIFATMLPSRVLKECDEVAYRCGFNDWLDGEDVAEIDGDYFDLGEVEEIEQEIEDKKEEGGN